MKITKVQLKKLIRGLVEECIKEDSVKTRLLGTCGFCDRRFKAPKEHLAFHGFERPGFGFTIGSCPGSHQEPFEISPVTAQLGVDLFKETGKDLKRQLKKHAKVTVLTIPDRSQGHGATKKVYKDKVESWNWERLHNSEKEKLEYQIKQAAKLAKHYQKKVDNWKPGKLGSVEEKQADKKQKAEVVRQQKLERYTTNRDKTIQRLQNAFNKVKKAEAVLKKEKDPNKVIKALVNAAKAGSIIYDTFYSKPEKLRQNHPDPISREEVLDDWNMEEMFRHMGLKTSGGDYVSRREADNMATKAFHGDYEEFYQAKGLDAWKPFWPGWTN